jgi:ferredoxin
MLSRKNGIQGLAMTAPSGYSVTFDIERCNLCGKCVRTCQYSAIKIVENDEKERLDYSKDFCMGCGACVSQCPNESISLIVDPDKGAIFDVDSMVELTRKTISNHRL